MAKKMWVYSPTANDDQKKAISNQFEPVLEALRKNIMPLPEPQEFNHCIDVFSKWKGDFFYIMQKFKTGKNSTTDFFEVGLARLEYYGENRFNLSYFRHTGKWQPIPIYNDISFETAKEAILEDELFYL